MRHDEHGWHFDLNDRFPSGREGLRDVVERAEARGIHVGVHTLSNFITTNDPYVTPVPDPRLARVGSSRLAAGFIGSRPERCGLCGPTISACNTCVP